MSDSPRLASFHRFWERMVAPPPAVKEPLTRHRIRFLNSLLLIFIPLASFAVIMQILIMPFIDIVQDTTAKAVLMGIGMVLIIYIINHTPYYPLVNYLAIGMGFIAVMVNAAASSAPHIEIIYFIVLPLVGIMLLSLREIIVVCLLSMICIYFFAKAMGDIPDDIFRILFTFTFIAQAFIIFASHQRNLLEIDRRQQMIEKEKVRILAQFFQDVSHEFRTPLSIINTGVYLIGKTPDAGKRQERISGIQKQVAYITKLLDDMLTLTRLDSRTLSVSTIAGAEIVSNVVTAAQAGAAAKGLTLDLDLQTDVGMMQGDSEELQTALEHLLKNAIDYTSQGNIRIRAFKQPTTIFIEIEDPGIGIPEVHVPYIFGRFYRVDYARSTPGTGLGLAIVQKIISDHQGRIEVETVLGQGSLFRVILPTSEAFRKDGSHTA